MARPWKPILSSAATASVPRSANSSSTARAAQLRRRGRLPGDLSGRAAAAVWIPDCTKWWGRDRHCLPYYLTGRRDEVYAIGVVPIPRWEGDNEASIPATRDQYLEAFSGFHADLQRVLEAVDSVTLWPVYDRERNDCWSRGNLVLLGDACHPMRPFMAAGGAMAVEDAAILSRCLATFDDPATAFRSYDRDPHFQGWRSAENFPRQYLDGRPDRHRLVLLLRCLHGAACRARLSRRCLKPSPTL
jgi:2-polyprenyl-6-methoxyphenol hydroxylase-like FAD-dependent oxidoreductase